MNKLIFFLNKEFLEIYLNTQALSNIVYECRSSTKPLNLATDFEQVWKNIYNEFILDTNEFEIIIDHNAGFTDTRIIAVWCRSEVMFDSSKSLKIIKNGEVLEEIQYSHKPKIGISK
jgi:uncharacterized LabA/DUF88 family protein